MAEAVGLGINAGGTDPLKTIGSMVNFATGVQNLQRGNLAIQQDQIKLQERQAIQSLFRNPDQFKGKDGMPDYDKMIELGMSAAPTTFPTMVPQIIQAKREAIGAQQAFNALGKQGMEAVGQYFGGMKGLDPKTVDSMVNALGKQNPQLQPWINIARRNMIDRAIEAKDQDKLDQATQNISKWALTVPEQRQATTPQPYTVQTGQETRAINLNPAAGQVGSTIPGTQAKMQVAPGALETVETALDGSKHIVRRTPSGAIVEARPLSQGQPNAAIPGGYSPLNPQPGQMQDVPALAQERAQIGQAAQAARQSEFNNQQIVKLADETNVGRGAEILSRLGGGYAGIPWTSDSSSNFNRLGHYIARESANMANSMGLNATDSGRRLSEEANVSTGWTKDAIKSAAKVNNAIATGVIAYQQGMEKAIANAGGNVLAAREFKTEWTKNFDVNAMRLLNAVKTGDKSETESVIKDMGGRNSAKMKEMRAKIVALDNLMTNGRQ